MPEFNKQISQALGEDVGPTPPLHVRGEAELPSCYRVTDLAMTSMGAAMTELAGLIGARQVALDRRLASLWFDMTIQPMGWELPSPWDPIAGVYRAADGWIRLHTNAPHHRDAALSVLAVRAERQAVAKKVSVWQKTELETAVVKAGGAAAAMHSVQEWKAHPQGRAVMREPLIAWQRREGVARRSDLEDIKVLDLTRVLAGPVATRFLAGFGACVLRIDPPSWNEPGVEPEVTLGKTCAGLDLTQTTDRQKFEALLSEADLLIHGYRPGALDALGYDRAFIQRHAPHLIDVSLCAYGWSGPWATRRGFDSLVQMSCGIADEGMSRTRAQKPVPLPVQALDHATGYLMAAAALRALRLRAATGQVSSARLSLARTAALLMSVAPRDMTGAPPIVEDGDLAPDPEVTAWGPARRIAFPATVDGRGPHWRTPAGPLRSSEPTWACASRAPEL